MASELSRPHVWKPASDPADAPTLLLLHGTGADERDLLGLGKLLVPDANLLSPRGLVEVDGMLRHFVRYPDGSFDEPGIRLAAADLASFSWLAAVKYGFNPDRVWAVGFSNGANAAGAMLLTQPDSVAGIVAFGTTKSFTKPLVPAPDLAGKRVFIANGRLDDYSPAAKTAEMVAEFEELGANVKVLLHGGGHTIVNEHVRLISEELIGI